MSFLGNEQTDILLAGHQRVMYKIDVEQGVISQEVFKSSLPVLTA